MPVTDADELARFKSELSDNDILHVLEMLPWGANLTERAET